MDSNLKTGFLEMGYAFRSFHQGQQGTVERGLWSSVDLGLGLTSPTSLEKSTGIQLYPKTTTWIFLSMYETTFVW